MTKYWLELKRKDSDERVTISCDDAAKLKIIGRQLVAAGKFASAVYTYGYETAELRDSEHASSSTVLLIFSEQTGFSWKTLEEIDDDRRDDARDRLSRGDRLSKVLREVKGGMSVRDAKALAPGIYLLWWVDGGSSLAAVGELHDGSRWFAPINWATIVEERIASTSWCLVDHVELVISPAMFSAQ